jgi:glycerate kinase
MIGMDEHLQGAQFVITGEGRLDGQTGRGKAPLGVAKRAAKLGIPVIALAGSVGEGAGQLNEMGITSYFPIVSGPMPLEQAMDPAVAGRHLRTTARQLFRLIRAADGRG